MTQYSMSKEIQHAKNKQLSVSKGRNILVEVLIIF
jgi:hypothetical protein